ncbi:MAG: OmpH family outer membrane protein, partial [Methylovulum sp.]|nr:OmpH family outer membrane protein [Methylovulum sp.]
HNLSPMEQQGYTVSAPSFYDNNDLKNHDNPDYRACVKKITEDPLISDLQSKLDKYQDMDREKGQRERAQREQTESTLANLVSAYGQAHGYQLIIGNGDQYVLFNRSKTVLDITADLLDFIGQQPLATPPPVTN